MKLYSSFGGFRTNKVLTTAAFAETPVELAVIDWAKIKDAEFLKKNPNGKVPVLETKDGFIFESNAIVRHIARSNKDKQLYGSNEYQQSLVDQWLDWTSLELEPPLIQLILPVLGWAEADKDKNKKAISDTMSALRILDNHLKVNNFIVGSNITLADIVIANTLVFPFRLLWEEKFRKNFTSVTKWFESVANLPAFTQVWGKLRFCQKQWEPAQLEKKEAPKKEQKKEQPKQEKKEAKKEAPKKEKNEDEEPKEKSEKNPLDALPASKFDLFAFKTLFVNAPDKKEAFKFFVDNYDPEGYSIYFVHYIKAEGEGKVLFLTNNLMNGTLQRLETFRKYAFAVHGVYGEEPNLEIQGVWVWRGVGIPNEVKDLPNYEYHEYTKLDLNNEADRKKVEEYWTKLNEDDVVDGFRAREVKYFK